MSIFSAVWANIHNFFIDAEKEVITFIDSLAHSILVNGGALLVQSAKDAVAAAQSTGGTGEEKLAAATSKVITDLEAGGIPIVLNAINGAIEAAVAEMHKTQTADANVLG